MKKATNLKQTTGEALQEILECSDKIKQEPDSDEAISADDYVREVVNRAKQHGLADNISIGIFKNYYNGGYYKPENLEATELGKFPEVTEIAISLYCKYKITISGLHIALDTCSIDIPRCGNSSASVPGTPGGYIGDGIWVEFNGNEFCRILGQYSGTIALSRSNGEMIIVPHGTAWLSLVDNRSIKVAVRTIYRNDYRRHKAEFVLELYRNRFGGPTSIYDEGLIISGCQNNLKEFRAIHASGLCISTENQNKYPGLSPVATTTSLIRISDNKFKDLLISNCVDFYSFTGANTIDSLRVCNHAPPESVSHIYWNAYQRLDKNGYNAHSHKKIFTTWEKQAFDRGDTTQAMIFRREIARCDHAIVCAEHFTKAWQDRLIFAFGKYVSNYGTSWIRALVCLLLVNTVVTLLFCIHPDISIEDKACFIFANLLNPLHDIPGLLGVYTNTAMSFLSIAHKITYAVLAYELVKTFRRFGKSYSRT